MLLYTWHVLTATNASKYLYPLTSQGHSLSLLTVPPPKGNQPSVQSNCQISNLPFPSPLFKTVHPFSWILRLFGFKFIIPSVFPVMVKSSENGSVSVAPFLKKCYDMVDDESTDSIISWSQNGESFVIWDMTEFSVKLLPKYFKHNNFSSFIRQLNIYVCELFFVSCF